jgi:hypothetical protein
MDETTGSMYACKIRRIFHNRALGRRPVKKVIQCIGFIAAVEQDTRISLRCLARDHVITVEIISARRPSLERLLEISIRVKIMIGP